MEHIQKQAENKNKTLLENRNSTIMRCQTAITGPECVTNIQWDTIIHNKTQTEIHRQEEQLNKRTLKKSMIQQILFQSYAYIRKRSHSLDESTTE
jgi:hypothetical protein